MSGSFDTVAPTWASWGTARTAAADASTTGTDRVKRRAMSAARTGTGSSVRMFSTRSTHTTRSSGWSPWGSMTRSTAAVGR